MTDLDPPRGCLLIIEDRHFGKSLEDEVDAGIPKEVQLAGRRRNVIDPDEGCGPQTQPCRREGRVGRASTQLPTARIAANQIATGRTDMDDIDRPGSSVPW